jgi:hypothetical protein
MAEKEEPKPKLYNPLHDKSIDDVLKDYHSLYTPDVQEKFREERTQDRENLYATVVGHLAQHGTDEKTKELKRKGYHDHKEKKKWAEDLVHRLALHGVAKHFGTEAVGVYANNHELLRKYVEENMAMKEIGGYDGLIELFANSKNLRADFHEDGGIRKVIDNYLENINTQSRKEDSFVRHLAKPENYEAIHKFAEGKLKDHKLQPKKGVGIEELLTSIKMTAHPELHPQLKRLRGLEEIKEEKKK